uniref:hypothetical protein n=1 Tax=Paenibacillus sp. FSL R7-0216 TaxID=2921677 RepID=UPI00403F52ED
MRGSLYAVRSKSGWELRVSLDLKVDLSWWMDRNSESIYLLSDGMPLGWAVEVRDHFKLLDEMDRWSDRQWDQMLVRELQEELRIEARLMSSEKSRDLGELLKRSSLLGERRGWLWKEGRLTELGREFTEKGAFKMERNISGPMLVGKLPADKVGKTSEVEAGETSMWGRAGAWGEATPLVEAAQRLAAALEGRSLLEAELQQLLAERLPGFAPAWRSAVQHAHLQGRVQLTAGVASARRRDAGPRWRRARAPRCRRCGSEVHRRTPCGSCGSRGCAYCEACLALGRSRSCALLLRGSSAGAVPPPGAGGGTAAGLAPTGSLLDRWGLSPAQRSAAGRCASWRKRRKLLYLAGPAIDPPLSQLCDARTLWFPTRPASYSGPSPAPAKPR